MPKARQFFIMQYAKHPETGEVLMTEAQIEEGLDHKTIGDWAWICHDKDTWSEADEIADPNHKQGETKPPHYHIAISLPKNNVEVSVIARWFGVPMQFVEVARGRGAFLDCVEYLVHENAKGEAEGKYHYNDPEVHSSCDWRKMIEDRRMSRAKYGGDYDTKTLLRMQVKEGKLTLRQLSDKYPVNYINDLTKLQQLRFDYLKKKPMPKKRRNFYIYGAGGVGKDVASYILAHALFPDIENTDDLYFYVGADDATFMGYDGQPVIIWSDFRSSEIWKACGTRGNIFAVFDPHPKAKAQNVKYSSMMLTNEVNIVNSVQPFPDFIEALAGNYTDRDGIEHKAEDEGQAYRRFPYIMPLRADDFDILISENYMGLTDDVKKYRGIYNIEGNFGKLAKMFPDNVATYDFGTKMLTPLVEADKKYGYTETPTVLYTEEQLARLGTVDGKQVSIDDLMADPSTPEQPAPEQNFNLSFDDYKNPD